MKYQLFGFLLRDGETAHLWVDPGAQAQTVKKIVQSEFSRQKLVFSINYVWPQTLEPSQNTDGLDTHALLSFPIPANHGEAWLYVLPRRPVLSYHREMIDAVIRCLGTALQNSLSIKKLEIAALVDPLTNCCNRRGLARKIESDIAFARRYDRDLSVVMVDIDDFKTINDTYGHEVGDAVLKAVSATLCGAVRTSDTVGRYGGEEFALVLPETSLRNAIQLAEKLRMRLKQCPIRVAGRTISVSASFGVASLSDCGGREELFREADRMLYVAKARGKDNVAPDPVTSRALPSVRASRAARSAGAQTGR